MSAQVQAKRLRGVEVADLTEGWGASQHENYLIDKGTPAARPARKAGGLSEGDGLAAETDAAGAIAGMQHATL